MRAARCAAPTAGLEAVIPFRRGRTLAGPHTRRAEVVAPYSPAPTTPARQSQARNGDRTNCNFGTTRPQWTGLNCGKPLRFCAPEIQQHQTAGRPPAILKVNWPAGPREGGLGHWFLSHRWERNSPTEGGEIPCKKPPKRRVREAAPYRREQNLRGRRGRAPALPGCGKTSPATKSPAHLIP